MSASLFKQFNLHRLREGTMFEIRLETFNTLNYVQFCGPNSTQGSGSFGGTCQANSPRQLIWCQAVFLDDPTGLSVIPQVPAADPVALLEAGRLPDAERVLRSKSPAPGRAGSHVCAEHVRQLEGESSFDNLMEVKS